MTDESLIEAVARAICTEHGIDPDKPLQTVWVAEDAPKLKMLAYEEWEMEAQAAIKAHNEWLAEQDRKAQFESVRNEHGYP